MPTQPPPGTDWPSIADWIGYFVAALPGLVALWWNWRSLPGNLASSTLTRIITCIENAATAAQTLWADAKPTDDGRFLIAPEKQVLLLGHYNRIQTEITNLQMRGLIWTDDDVRFLLSFNQSLTFDRLDKTVRAMRLTTDVTNLITALETAKFRRRHLLWPRKPTSALIHRPS